MERKRRILVADDEELNFKLIKALLADSAYEVIHAKDGEEAVRNSETVSPDLIILDVMMPVMDGLEATRALKERPGTSNIPIIIVTAVENVNDRIKAIEYGADDFLNKPVEKLELLARIKSLIKVKDFHDMQAEYKKRLELEVQVKTESLTAALKELNDAHIEMIYVLSRAAEYRDNTTGNHINRVSMYSGLLAAKLGLDRKQQKGIYYASPMHDIGKIAIPDKILLKPDKLDEEERKIMMQHTVIGAEMLKGLNNELISLSSEIALSHHEKWDGTGYPYGLSGDRIPLSGRIVAIADVFDAIMSHRPYKRAWSFDEAYSYIIASAGTQFDPEVAEAFSECRKEFFEVVTSHQDVYTANEQQELGCMV